MQKTMRSLAVMPIVIAAMLLSGCVVTQSKYNQMLQQQQALEASLRSEIGADQVKIDQLENGIRVRMSSDLLYPEGDVDLNSSGRTALSKISGQLATMASQNNQIDVVGNTDNIPIGAELARKYPSNWELAGARAAIVVRYLQQQGVPPTNLAAVSHGEFRPVASNDTPQGRAQNRRTEILIFPH